MGIFGQSTPFDADIDKATSETNTNENWSLILDVCDKVTSYPRSGKDCLKAIMKRMGHADPHVVMQAITLLDACANNCGKSFHLEIASREFENEFRRLLSKAQPKVSLKMRQVLKNWAENDFKNDSELILIPSLYNKLRHEGYDFSNLNEKPTKSTAKVAASKDPNVVSSQQEEDDIAKAIELSLKENKNSPKHQSSGNVGSTTASTTSSAYPSLYPSFSGSGSLGSITTTGAASSNSTASQPEPRKVRALYDFEAAEENELTFFAGEIIHVLDDSDPNWWKGFNQRGDGLFPSNFVTADLSVEPEHLDINQQNKSKKNVQFEDDAKELQEKTEAAAAAVANQRVEIDEAKVDRLLHLLHEANPEDPSQDTEEMLRLEQEVNQMGPLIDAELERVDRKHAQLTQLSSDLVDAINLYHSLMRDDRAAIVAGGVVGGFLPGAGIGMQGALPGMGYQGPPNALYGAAGYPGNFQLQHSQMPAQNYGMSSLPYGVNAGQIPTADTSTSGLTPYPSNTPLQSQLPIPMHYQNGHMHPQLNAALPHHMLPGQQAQQQQQQHIYGTPQLQQQAAPPPQHNQTNYQMLPTQQQQQQQYAQPPPTTTVPPGTTTTTQQSSTSSSQQHHQQQLQAQFMSPQAGSYMQQQPAAQQQQLSYATVGQPMPNGPQAFMNVPPHTTAHNPAINILPAINNNNPNSNNNNADQYSQLLPQMAAMSLSSMNPHQPVTQNFLVQNEATSNIPIYQQQR